ncbi:MAG: methionyl-tRNA formyltransferase [Patescibacteria group bacterium]
MKYIFFGTPKFAAIILEKLIESGLMPIAVVCNPDKPMGRKKILTAPPTKIIAQANKIPVFQPKKLSEIKNELKNINAEVFVVAAYNKIISEEIINIPKFKTVGVHPSLLPKYRGASPIQTAILNGDKETGVDLFLIDKGIDHGPAIASAECEISEKDNYETLEAKLAELGAKLLIENLPKYLTGDIKPQEQDHSKATLTKKFSTEDGYVNLPPSVIASAQGERGNPYKEIASSQIPRNDKKETSAELIFNKIRALNPDPGVFTFFNTKTGEKRVKLLEAKLIRSKPFDKAPSTSLRTSQDKLELLKVQPEGKKSMSYKDFLNGLKSD